MSAKHPLAGNAVAVQVIATVAADGGVEDVIVTDANGETIASLSDLDHAAAQAVRR